jgi:hypothetical protein
MTSPHPPPAVAPPPHIRDDERAAPILTQHRRSHVDSLQHDRYVAFDIDDALVQAITMNSILRQNLKPPLPRHGRRRGMHKNECIVLVEDVRRHHRIPLFDTRLESFERVLEFGGHSVLSLSHWHIVPRELLAM